MSGAGNRRVLDDLPVQQDLLGYGPYATAIAGILDDEALETPYCVGIYGAWGTGKTTFMSMIEQRLQMGPDNVIWFQPWLFDNKEEVWKALIYTALQHLENVRARREILVEAQAERVRRLFLGLGKLTLNTALAAVPITGLNVDQLSDLVSRTERDVTQFVNTFRLEFESLKNDLLGDDGSAGARLLFFIDDLDRCTPESCITALEAIKLFFDMRGCVFILGIDRELVQRGVEMKYGADTGINGESYLEKLVQLPFHLPPVRSDSFSRFLVEVTQDLNFSKPTRDLLALASDQNPRRAKRLASCLNLVRSVAHSMSADSRLDLDDEKLATLLILQVRFPLEYLWLSRTPVTIAEAKKNGGQPVAHFLEPVLGERLAKVEAQRFIDFLGRSELAGFSDRTEMDTYMRLTGVVDVGEPPVKKPLIELLDRRLAGLPPEGEQALESLPAEQSDSPTDAPDDGDVAALEAEAEDLWLLWQKLNERISLTKVFVGMPSVSAILADLHHLELSASTTLAAFHEMPSHEQPASLRRKVQRLRTIDGQRLLGGLRSAALWTAAVSCLLAALALYWFRWAGDELLFPQVAIGTGALGSTLLARLFFIFARTGRSVDLEPPQPVP